MSMTTFLHYVVLFGAYAIAWFLVLFCMLPMPMGSPRDPESGAPLSPQIGRKALIASGVAAVLWLIFYALIAFKIMDL